MAGLLRLSSVEVRNTWSRGISTFGFARATCSYPENDNRLTNVIVLVLGVTVVSVCHLCHDLKAGQKSWLGISATELTSN